ncbi:hypothetical protein [Thermococcus sp.]|uniref:hypothetical protein n=1 Tax=Thermococcus sp. TaxID=35749 RepID=UPI0026136F72|nr:hypothetical protein [Thermococcus sp.]
MKVRYWQVAVPLAFVAFLIAAHYSTAVPHSSTGPEYVDSMMPESLLKEVHSFKPPNTTKIIDPPWIKERLKNGTPIALESLTPEQIVERGLGIIKISIVSPKESTIYAKPGEKIPVEVRITYLGGSKAPNEIQVYVNSPHGIRERIFVWNEYVNKKKLPKALDTPDFRCPAGYDVPVDMLFEFDNKPITLKKNSSVVVKGYLKIPEFIKGGQYYISPSVSIPHEYYGRSVVGTVEDSRRVTVTGGGDE